MNRTLHEDLVVVGKRSRESSGQVFARACFAHSYAGTAICWFDEAWVADLVFSEQYNILSIRILP